MPEAENDAGPTPPPPLPALSRTGDDATRAQNDWSGAKAAVMPFPELPAVREVVFKLLSEDISAGQAYLLGNPRGKGNSWVRVLLMTVGLIVLVLLVGRLLGRPIMPFGSPPAPRSSGGPSFVSLLVPILLPLSVVVVFFFYILRATRKEEAKALARSEMHYLWLTTGYLGIRDALAETRNRWASVAGVEENAKYFFVRYRNGSLTPIPKRAFESEADARAFHDEMTRLWRAGVRLSLIHI